MDNHNSSSRISLETLKELAFGPFNSSDSQDIYESQRRKRALAEARNISRPLIAASRRAEGLKPEDFYIVLGKTRSFGLGYGR